MWIETRNGDLVNLDHVTRLFVASEHGDRQICLYARLAEKKEAGYVDFVLATFAVNAEQSVDRATELARQQLQRLRRQIGECQLLLEPSTAAPQASSSS